MDHVARWLPPLPEPARVTRLVAVAAAIGNRDLSATRAFFDETERVLGWMDVHGAASGDGLAAFVERCLLPDVIEARGMDDRAAAALIARVASGNLSPTHEMYVISLMRRELAQPYFSDLIAWPCSDALRDPHALVHVARTKKGRALAPILTRCAIRRIPVRSSRRRRARRSRARVACSLRWWCPPRLS